MSSQSQNPKLTNHELLLDQSEILEDLGDVDMFESQRLSSC